MNGYTDFGSMQRAAERRVYEMQRRAAGALNGGQQTPVKPNGYTDTPPTGETTKRRNCSGDTPVLPFGLDCSGQCDPPVQSNPTDCPCAEPAPQQECEGVSSNVPCQSCKGKPGGLLGGIGSPDRLLKNIPDEYLLMLVLVMLIREQCDLRLIIAIVYILM